MIYYIGCPIGFEYFSKEKLIRELAHNPQKFGGAFHFVIKTFYPEFVQ